MKASPLPIRIGISGHMDIHEDAYPIIKEKLTTQFQFLKEAYPNTDIKIISGVAPGAETIAFEVALEVGLQIVAVLPMPKDEYRIELKKKFKDEALKAFDERLSQYKQSIIELPMKDEKNQPYGSTQCYKNFRQYIVKQSHMVIALWDGILEQKDAGGNLQGTGTADVVRMCTDGNHDAQYFSLAPADKKWCEQLVTPRKKHNQISANDIKWKSITDTSILSASQAESQKKQLLKDVINEEPDKKNIFKEIDAFKKTDAFNAYAQKLSSEKIDSYTKKLEEDAPELKKIHHLIHVWRLASTMAQKKEKILFRSIIAVTFCAFLSIFTQQVYAGLYLNFELLLLHIGLLIVTLGLYLYLFQKGGRVEAEYTEWRTLAEGLRVQIFWYAAGVNERTHNYYHATKLNEMDWIISTINNLMTDIKPPKMGKLHWVKKNWIENQINYFNKNKNKMMINDKITQKISMFFLYLGGFLMLLTGLIASPNSSEYISKIFPTSASVNEQINVILFISAMAIVIFAFIKNHATQSGYEEIGLRYQRQLAFFERANQLMEQALSTSPVDTEKAHKVLIAIGKEALNENSAWLQLHNMNPFDFDVA